MLDLKTTNSKMENKDETYGTVTEKDMESEEKPQQVKTFNSIHFRIEPIIFFYMFAVIGSFPLIQQFFFEKAKIERCLAKDNLGFYCGNSTEPDFDNDTRKEMLVAAQKKSSEEMRNLLIAAAVPSMIMLPIFGAYSDDVGRRPGLIIPAFGRTILSAFMIVVAYLNLPNYWFYLGCLLEGFSGSSGVYLANAFALLADITPVESRPVKILIAEAFVATASALAGLTTGLLIKNIHFTWTFVFYGAIVALNFIYVVLIIREPNERPKPICTCNKFTAYLVGTFKTYMKSGPSLRRVKLLVFLFLFMAIDFSLFTTSGITNLYQMGKPFEWDSERQGYYMFITAIVQLFGAVVGIYVLGRVLKVSLITITGIGFISMTAKNAVNAFADTDFLLYLVIPMGILSMLPTAMIRALLSKTAGKEEQGEIFAGVGVSDSLMRIVGGVVGTAVYQATVAIWPGFLYLVVAILSFLCGIICLVMYILVKHNDSKKADDKKELIT